MRILVTGATGNVGQEVARQLGATDHEVLLGLRDPGRAPALPGRAVRVDFAAREGLSEECDALFLMRPPQLTDPELFAAFLDPVPRATRVVFLSVQGAGEKGWLPHAGIERRIAAMGFDATFVRPSYFMENLTTTLWPELARNRRIFLPAGRLRLDWVSVRDIAALIVAALTGQIDRPVIDACTGNRAGFAEVADLLTRRTGLRFDYRSPGLVRFIAHERRQGTAWSFIGVLLLLHYLPRFGGGGGGKGGQGPECTDIPDILGRPAETLEDFIARHRDRFAALADL